METRNIQNNQNGTQLNSPKSLQSIISKLSTPSISSLKLFNSTQETLQTTLSKLSTPSIYSLKLLNSNQELLKSTLSKLSTSSISFEIINNIEALTKSQNNLSKLIENISEQNKNYFKLINSINIISIKPEFLNINFENDNEDEIRKLNKNLEYITLVNNINYDRLNSINNLSQKLHYTIDKEDEFTINTNLVPVEKVLPNFISYAYCKNSKYTLTEAYEKSDFKRIEQVATNILSYIDKINLLTYQRDKCNVFEWSREIFLLSNNIKNIVQNEDGFKNLVDLLFKGIYESSGTNNNRLILLMKHYNIEEHPIFLNIKYFRNFFGHRIKENYKKTNRAISYFAKVIQKKYPVLPSDWVKIQLQIYIDIEDMLKIIYDSLNNDLSLDKLNLNEVKVQNNK